MYTCPISVGRRSSQEKKGREREKEREKEKEKEAKDRVLPPIPPIQRDGTVMLNPKKNSSQTSVSSLSTSNSHLQAPDQHHGHNFGSLTPMFTGMSAGTSSSSTYGGSNGSSGPSLGTLTPTPSTLNLPVAGGSASAVSLTTAVSSSSGSNTIAPTNTNPTSTTGDIALSLLASFAPGAQFSRRMYWTGQAHLVSSSSSVTSAYAAEREKGKEKGGGEKDSERELADFVERMFAEKGSGMSGVGGGNGSGGGGSGNGGKGKAVGICAQPVGTVKSSVYFVGREGELETWKALGKPNPSTSLDGMPLFFSFPPSLLTKPNTQKQHSNTPPYTSTPAQQHQTYKSATTTPSIQWTTKTPSTPIPETVITTGIPSLGMGSGELVEMVEVGVVA